MALARCSGRKIHAVKVASPSDDPVKRDLERGWPSAGAVQRLVSAALRYTAVEHDLTLVTRNLQDFKGLRGLRARAPA